MLPCGPRQYVRPGLLDQYSVEAFSSWLAGVDEPTLCDHGSDSIRFVEHVSDMRRFKLARYGHEPLIGALLSG